MRLPTHSLLHLRRLALTTALMATGLAQAAGLGIGNASVSGGWSFDATSNGQPMQNTGSLQDLSGLDFVLGAGNLDTDSIAVGGGKSTKISQLWAANASLFPSDAATLQFQIGADSVLALSGSGDFGGGTDSSRVLLDAEMRVLSTGELDGTPVRLVLTGTADSLFSSTGPSLDVVPSFDLVVRDGDSNILASWQGLAAGSSASFSLSLTTRVGDTLFFSLSHDSTGLVGDASALLSGETVSASALLSGTVQVTAVPEPETYALFLVGLAAVGLLHQRQGQRRC